MYSRKLLMMGRDARNIWSFVTEEIWIINASGWLLKRNSLRCTVTWIYIYLTLFLFCHVPKQCQLYRSESLRPPGHDVDNCGAHDNNKRDVPYFPFKFSNNIVTVNQPLVKMSTRNIPGDKVGRCVRLTTYHHTVPLSRNLGALTS